MLARRMNCVDSAKGQLGREVNGGTTIAGTMILAQLAGIQVFATGGLGGVHKGGEASMDVSADLTELGRTPVAVISSGCKSFLDIPRTLEFLETQGVCVGTFADGRLGAVDFPAFWTRDSGSPSPRTIRDEKEAAAIIFAQSQLGINSGLLFANPIAQEFSLDKDQMDETMAQARSDAQEAGMTGPANTPFVLSRIRELTQGRTVRANRELVFANVVRGAKVAHGLAQLQAPTRQLVRAMQPAGVPPALLETARPQDQATANDSQTAAVHESETLPPRKVEAESGGSDNKPPVELVVVGSVALDVACHASEWNLSTSNKANITSSVGGVGKNIAIAAAECGVYTSLQTRIGAPSIATGHIESFLNFASFRLGHFYVSRYVFPGLQSAQYVALNHINGELNAAAADMSIFEAPQPPRSPLFSSRTSERINAAKPPSWLALDANHTPDLLAQYMTDDGIKNIAFEPVSTIKAGRIIDALAITWGQQERTARAGVALVTPNQLEAAAIAGKIGQLAPDMKSMLPFPHYATDNLDIVEQTERGRAEQKQLELWQVSSGNVFSMDVARQTLRDAIALLSFSRTVAVTLGPAGVLMVQRSSGAEPVKSELSSDSTFSWVQSSGKPEERGDNANHTVSIKHFPAPRLDGPVVSVNGAGDTFTGVLLAGLTRGFTLNHAVNTAQAAAAATLLTTESVSELIKPIFEEAANAVNVALPKDTRCKLRKAIKATRRRKSRSKS